MQNMRGGIYLPAARKEIVARRHVARIDDCCGHGEVCIHHVGVALMLLKGWFCRFRLVGGENFPIKKNVKNLWTELNHSLFAIVHSGCIVNMSFVRQIKAIHFSVRDNGVIRKLAAYVILGVSKEGRKEVLSIQIMPGVAILKNLHHHFSLSDNGGLHILFSTT